MGDVRHSECRAAHSCCASRLHGCYRRSLLFGDPEAGVLVLAHQPGGQGHRVGLAQESFVNLGLTRA